MLQKSKVAEVQTVKGEAAFDYREPLTTRQRRTSSGDAVLSAFPEGKQQGEFFIDLGSDSLFKLEKPIMISQQQVIHSFCHAFALVFKQH